MSGGLWVSRRVTVYALQILACRGVAGGGLLVTERGICSVQLLILAYFLQNATFLKGEVMKRYLWLLCVVVGLKRMGAMGN